ncbi:MAG: hypothetical protein Q9166_000047 [cf. Caloplaca sp. 2 TL-2023]
MESQVNNGNDELATSMPFSADHHMSLTEGISLSLNSRPTTATETLPNMSLLPFVQGIERIQHRTGSARDSYPVVRPGSTNLAQAQDQPSVTGSKGSTEGQQHGRRYNPPPVDASRIVQKPVTRLQKEDSQKYQIGQLERRFSTSQKVEDGESTLAFQLVPSDPDFPFEMTGLDCVLHVPHGYPGDARPSLAIKNHDMPRGYQINVERGFDALAQASPHATLLSLMNALDKHLEALLTEPKAETIKIVSYTKKLDAQVPHDGRRMKEPPVETQIGKHPRNGEPQFTLNQRHDAVARRQAEINQLEARLGRLPSFSRSSDGIGFTIPVSPRKRGDLPVPLQVVQSVKLLVPLLYPLQPCRIEISGVSKEVAGKTERGFSVRARDNTELSLMAHINYFAQHMHTMATKSEDDTKTPDQGWILLDKLHLEGSMHEYQDVKGMETPNEEINEPEDDRSRIKVIPRPPEWTMEADQEVDSDSDFSGSCDSGDDSEDGDTQGQKSAPADLSTTVAERGITLNFPSLELRNIELLELTSVSLSIKCTRCKTSSDISNLRPSAPRDSSCPKCAQPCFLTFRPESMHINSFRAGYLDLTGCTIADMLPSTFVPTCSTCSIAVPGVVSVRGDATSIAICRECHSKLIFKIPEIKFMLVSNTSLHPRNLLPLRRKAPKENLGIVAGQELPRRGRCRHYAKSYRWFRFSCCAKVYTCDKCHDEEEAHPNEHANRMICGFCSREQNYRPEDCGICKATVVGKRGSGFWEGGKGTRDKGRMSRKDPRKYKRRPGTRVGRTE